MEPHRRSRPSTAWGHGAVHAERHLQPGPAPDGSRNQVLERPDFDTAVFSGNFVDYSILQLTTMGMAFDDELVVTDNVGTDGTDRVKHIERLQFADQAVLVSDLSTRRLPEQRPHGCAHDQRHDASEAPGADGVDRRGHGRGQRGPTNPTGTIGAPIGYFWQVETAAGTGIFDDITVSPRARWRAWRERPTRRRGSDGAGVACPSRLQGRDSVLEAGLLRSDGGGDGGEQRSQHR